MTDYRKELVQLYEQYNPEKLKDVDRLLTTFKGREAIMLDTLRSKYTSHAVQTNTGAVAVAAVPSLPQAPSLRHEERTSQAAVMVAPAGAGRVARMTQLLGQMSAVDLDELSRQLATLERDATADDARWPGTRRGLLTNANSARETQLFAHLLKFMQFFVTCSKEFLSLAQEQVRDDAVMAPHVTTTEEPAPSRGEANTHVAAAEPRDEPSSPPPAALSRGRGGSSARASHSPPASRARTQTPLSASPDRPLPGPALIKPPPLAASPLAPSSPPPLRPRRDDGRALVSLATDAIHSGTSTSTSSSGRTFTLSPSTARHAASVLAATSGLLPLQAGDTLLLEPGQYWENIAVSDAGSVVVRAAYPGTPVIVRSLQPTEPVVRVRGDRAKLVVSGVVFVGDRPAGDGGTTLTADTATQYVADPSLAAVPLVAASHAAEVVLDGCHFYRCGTAAVTAVGPRTRIRLQLCLVALCAFAGVYAYRGGVIDLVQSRVKCCEVGARASSGSSALNLTETTIENCATDGVVLHQGCTTRMTRSSVFNNKSNGALVASGASLEVVDSTIELNVLYGVQRFRGSYLHLKNSFIRDNGLLPINNADE